MALETDLVDLGSMCSIQSDSTLQEMNSFIDQLTNSPTKSASNLLPSAVIAQSSKSKTNSAGEEPESFPTESAKKQLQRANKRIEELEEERQELLEARKLDDVSISRRLM